MNCWKIFIVMALLIFSVFKIPSFAQNGRYITVIHNENEGKIADAPNKNQNFTTLMELPDGSVNHESVKPYSQKASSSDDMPSGAANSANSLEDYIFPDKLTVIDAGETEAVALKQKPMADSKALGMVYGSLAHVEVLGGEDGEYVKIRARDYDSGRLVDGYVLKKSIKHVSTNQNYGVVVDTDSQKVYIYKGNTLFKTFLCSTGMEGMYETPEGIYMIGSRGPSFYSKKYRQGAYNWVRFNKGYLFHSIPFDENYNIIASEADKLGTKASHGCVRLSVDDAKWFYENIPKNTVVIVTK